VAEHDHDAPVVAFAGTFGGHVRVLGKHHVDNSSLVRGHGLQLDGRAGGNDAACESESKVSEEHLAACPVPIDVNRNPDVGVECLVDHDPDDELDCPERLSAATNEISRVWRTHIESKWLEFHDLNVGFVKVHVMEKFAKDTPGGFGNCGCIR
jgi:hypothetical protein